MWVFLMKFVGVLALGALTLIGVNFVYGLSLIGLESLNERLNSEPKPEPEIEKMVIQNSLYLKQGNRVLDCGRGCLFDLTNGIVSEPDLRLTEPEQKRRIAGSIKSMPVLNRLLQPQQAALPMPQIKVMGADREDVVDL